MARAKSAEKRHAILESAVHQIALFGLGASTASIAKGANLAEGTLFTYFTTKTDLLNELYLELKLAMYSRINIDFPHGAELRDRSRHVWTEALHWFIENPEGRKVSTQLNVSHLVTAATRERIGSEGSAVAQAMRELAAEGAFKDLPPVFASAAISAMQDAVMETAAKEPSRRTELIEKGFKAFWRMVS